jgi:hypothetical protein
VRKHARLIRKRDFPVNTLSLFPREATEDNNLYLPMAFSSGQNEGGKEYYGTT